MSRFATDCPAKVNLTLTVGPIDERKYHPIRTLFQAIDLCDRLELEFSHEDRFECDAPFVPADNTVLRALRLSREYFATPPVAIRLQKRIPAGAGLGGGSSDAAGLLRILGLVSRGRLSPRDLHEIAVAVGADVPFFLVGGRALGEGYGEKLTPLEDAPPQPLILIMPEIEVSTPRAYALLDERERAAAPAEPSLGFNDFESVAPPECSKILRRVRNAGFVAGLTGSGAAMFVVGDDVDRVAEALRGGPPANLQLVRTISRNQSLAVEEIACK